MDVTPGPYCLVVHQAPQVRVLLALLKALGGEDEARPDVRVDVLLHLQEKGRGTRAMLKILNRDGPF